MKNFLKKKGIAVWRFVKYITKGPAAIISAYKSYYPEEVNRKRHEDLKADVRNLGYSYKEVEGYFEKEYEEDSLLIFNITFDDALNLANKYEQDWFIYVGKDNRIRGYDGMGNIVEDFGKVWDWGEEVGKKTEEKAKVKLYPRGFTPPSGSKPIKPRKTFPFYYEKPKSSSLLRIAERLVSLADELLNV